MLVKILMSKRILCAFGVTCLAVIGLGASAGAAPKPRADRSHSTFLSDPRRGEPVRQICLRGEVRDWNFLGDDAVVVRRAPSEYYLLTLTGACEARYARSTIGLSSRSGSPCIRRDDIVATAPGVSLSGQACTVEGLYRWRGDGPDGSAPPAITAPAAKPGS